MTSPPDDPSLAERVKHTRPPTDVLRNLLTDLLDAWLDGPNESRTPRGSTYAPSLVMTVMTLTWRATRLDSATSRRTPSSTCSDSQTRSAAGSTHDARDGWLRERLHAVMARAAAIAG
ncbi:MAG: hypothetical protein ACRDRH_05615 [Pseudonocardia sp.]